MKPETILVMAERIRTRYHEVAKEDADLFGGSLLDLAADFFPSYPLADLQVAIVASGLHSVVNARLQKQIASYGRATSQPYFAS